MATYGPKNLRISFTAEGLTHFGGLVQRFLQRLGLRRALTTSVWFPNSNKVPDSMPWILWNLPVKVRPRERAARPGSLGEV